MANHKSAIKRARQSMDRQMRNRSFKTRMKNIVKKARAAVDSGSEQEARAALIEAQKIIDRGAGRGIVHRKTASRKVSRLAKKVQGLGS